METKLSDEMGHELHQAASEILRHLQDTGQFPAMALATLCFGIAILAMGMNDMEMMLQPVTNILATAVAAEEARREM